MSVTKGKNKLLYSSVFAFVLLLALIFLYRSFFTAPKTDGPKILYHIPDTARLSAITGDLKYYDFIKNESALKFSLWVEGEVFDKDIKRDASYELTQSMNTWQIADILLNHVSTGPNYGCDHGCPEGNFSPALLPGGELAPTISQKYEWIKTYEDWVESIGHDGGQLSSEQYYQKTGIRKCVSPDGREFTEGKEGWATAIGG